jgi:hypothetical protein
MDKAASPFVPSRAALRDACNSINSSNAWISDSSGKVTRAMAAISRADSIFHTASIALGTSFA